MLSGQNKSRLAVTGIFLIALLAIILNFPTQIEKAGFDLPESLNKPFHLGLDLQGGTHLIYKADTKTIPLDQVDSAIEGVRDVIERRVNAFGVAEPLIQTTKSGDEWRLIVELAGVSDVNKAIAMIGETPLLEFKETNPNPQIDLTQAQQKELEEFNNQVKALAEEVLQKSLVADADFEDLAETYSQDPGSASNGGDLGFVPRGLFVPEFEQSCFDDLQNGEISKNLVKTQFGYHIIKRETQTGEGDGLQVNCKHIMLQTRDESFYIDPNDQWLYTGLTGNQLTRAQVIFEPNTQAPQISLEFNNEGVELFSDITVRNIGRPVAIFLDGLPISTPTVQQEISDGRAVISGQFTIQETRLLAQRLNAGALPIPIEVISQQTVGASLGASSVEKSLIAGVIGLIAVSLFMIIYYRLLGITAVIALLFYGLVVLAIFKLIPVTLTLSGIAGFILSIGMAVDANVLIFERFKEELRNGKQTSIAINEGFKRAWPSIFDGNISTLITCLILIGFTTSSVKGFAVTLSIGILISMFSAMVVTKIVLKALAKSKALNKPWILGVGKINK